MANRRDCLLVLHLQQSVISLHFQYKIRSCPASSSACVFLGQFLFEGLSHFFPSFCFWQGSPFVLSTGLLKLNYFELSLYVCFSDSCGCFIYFLKCIDSVSVCPTPQWPWTDYNKKIGGESPNKYQRTQPTRRLTQPDKKPIQTLKDFSAILNRGRLTRFLIVFGKPLRWQQCGPLTR